MAVKPIILITSCAYHLERNAQCRDTWLKKWKSQINYKFVFGRGYAPKYEDEITFNVDDSYHGLPAKVQASHKWALEQGYDFILKTDCDIYLHVPRLLKSGFENFPYSGNHYWPSAQYPFALGSAYWLNKAASEILVKTPLPPFGIDGGDDMWIGRVMHANNIPLHHEPRYEVGSNPDFFTAISVHATDLKTSMYEAEKRFKCV